MKRGRLLNDFEGPPSCSALSGATENNPNAELGIRIILPCTSVLLVRSGRPQIPLAEIKSVPGTEVESPVEPVAAAAAGPVRLPALPVRGIPDTISGAPTARKQGLWLEKARLTSLRRGAGTKPASVPRRSDLAA